MQTSTNVEAKRRTAFPDPQADSGEERRRGIMKRMRAQPSAMRGEELASYFHVSRQCIVQDVAILRAGGNEIVATPRGYRLPDLSTTSHRAILACCHKPERTREELQILVDNGVKILDVLVEHPVYGELRGVLMLESRADVEDFLRQVKRSRASLLSTLTDGVHLHTVEASRPAMIARAKVELREKGLLLK